MKQGAITTNMRSLMQFPDGYNGPTGSQGTLVVKLTPPRNASKCHIFSFFDFNPLPNIYFYSIWFGRPPQKKSTRILATSNSDSLQNDTLFFYHVNGPIKKKHIHYYPFGEESIVNIDDSAN